MKIDGVAVAAIAAGGIFVYAGIKGYSVPQTIQNLVTGKSPTQQGQANPVTTPVASSSSSSTAGGSSYTPGAASISAYKAYAMLLVEAQWPGQFAAFNNIVMAESGWNNKSTNPGSGAFGIAQALGHGNANTRAADGENNYGNYGTTDATCLAANEGSGQAQIRWMINYIAQVYKSPNQAWAYHQANGSY